MSLGPRPAVSGQITAAKPSETIRVRVIQRRHPMRWLSGAAVGLMLFLGGIAVAQSPNISWSTVAEYFFDGTILEGLKLTIILSVVSLLVGIMLGTLLATMRLSSNPVFEMIAVGFIAVFRGTPLLIQIIFWFNIALVIPVVTIGWPDAGLGVQYNMNTLMTPAVAAILALGLNESAYMAEIVRGGIISVPRGQEEAATALGLTQRQAMWRVVLPQAVRSIVPPTGNQMIIMLKNTSLVSVIAAREILTAAQQIYSTNFYTIELLLVAAGWYLVMTAVATVGQSFLEKKLDYSQRNRRSTLSERALAGLRSLAIRHEMEVKKP